MNLFGGIGFIAALVNYRNAKKAYDKALANDNSASVLAAISQYDSRKYAQLDAVDKEQYAPAPTDKFIPAGVLNVGMMVGDKCRMQGVISITNETDHQCRISDIEATFYLYGEPLGTCALAAAKANIAPNDTKIYEMFPATSIKAEYQYDWMKKDIAASLEDVYVMTEPLQKARKAIQHTNGTVNIPYPPLTSCKVPTTLLNILTADVWFRYRIDDGKEINSENSGIAKYKGVKCAFVYKGENYYPAINNG